MKSTVTLLVVLSAAVVFAGAGSGAGAPPPPTQCAPVANYPAATTPVAFWSTEARCAIVPAGPANSLTKYTCRYGQDPFVTFVAL